MWSNNLSLVSFTSYFSSESELMATTSSREAQNENKVKTDRDQLLGGEETKPRSRTLKEIVAKYRKAKSKDASSLAADARNKLVQRHEKLEKISNQTEELEARSEDYESLAKELVKKMEKRKWWHI